MFKLPVVLSLAVATFCHGAIFYGSRWPDGNIAWYYNPAGQPAAFSKEQVLVTMNQSMQNWQAGCKVRFVYMGETNAAPAIQNGVTTVGWGKSQPAGYQAYTNSWVANGTRLYNEADITFDPALVSKLSDLGGLAAHELGHLLGLDHSDQPQSVMFADPYNPDLNMTLPTGDDLATCAKMYGAPGLVPLPGYLTAPTTPNAAYDIQFNIHLANAPGNPLTRVAANTAGYLIFSVQYGNLPVGSALSYRLITPGDSIYAADSWQVTATDAGARALRANLDTDNLPKLDGQWALQLLRDGQVLASQPFAVEPRDAKPALPDIAVVARPDSKGSLMLESRNLSPDRGVLDNYWGVDDTLVGTGATVSAPVGGGAHTLFQLTRSTNPRYTDNGSQPGFDGVQRLDLTLGESGQLTASRLSAVVSGNRAAATLDAQVTVATPGTQQLYIGALYGDQLFFRTSAGWGTSIAPALSFQSPAAVGLSVLDRFDLRSLPSGIQIYAGYGSSLDDLLAKGQLALRYTTP
jgi:hypothetical protein